MLEANTDTELYCLVGIALGIAIFLLVIGLAIFLNDFTRELRYLNAEIDRTEGAERRYWIRQRRRLWLSLIPFVRYRK